MGDVQAPCIWKSEHQYPDGWVIEKQAWHFHARLWLRYGVILKAGEHAAIARRIRNRACVVVNDQPEQSIVDVLLPESNKVVTVVWDKRMGHLVTALSPRLARLRSYGRPQRSTGRIRNS